MSVSESLAFLEAVLTHEPIGFGLVDRQFRFLRVNERLAAINGLTVEAHRGRTVCEVLGPELWASRSPLFERALAGETIENAHLWGRLDPADIERRRVLASYYPVRSAMKVTGIAIAVRDVTEQTQAREALETREQEYRLVFDSNPQPMWVYDTVTLNFLAVNGAALQVYGYSREEFLAMSIRDIRPVEDVAALQDSVATLRTGVRQDGPWRHLYKDGTQVWVEVTSGSLTFQGRAARLITVSDVTERRRLEEERRTAAQRQQTFLRDVLASVTAGKLRLCDTVLDLPKPHAPFGDPIPLTQTGGLRDLRYATEAAAAEFSEERWQDLVTAASEAGMNAVVHAGGGLASIRTNGDTIQVWIEDRGRGIAVEHLPRATLQKGYSSAGTLGYGMKMMLSAIDRLWLLTGSEGTTVVLEQDRVPPPAAWD